MKRYHVTGYWSDSEQKGDFCKWKDVNLLEEENKKLRESLGKIVSMRQHDGYAEGFEMVDVIQFIAREALNKEAI